MTYAVQIIAAFFGSMGFSMLYNTRRTKMLISSLGGAIGWSVYLLINRFVSQSVPLAYFIAAMCITVYAEIFARVKKTPTTTFLVVGIIPMIPGGALYYTMNYAFANDIEAFFNTGMYTLKAALSLAVGIIVVSTAVRLTTAGAEMIAKHFNKRNEKTD